MMLSRDGSAAETSRGASLFRPLSVLRRPSFTFALAVVTAVVGMPAPAQQQPIRIGASLGLTGSYADLGQTLQRGYQLCVKQANEKGGLLKRRLELTVVDDKSQPADAVAIYERQEGDCVAGGPRARASALPDPAVEPALTAEST